MMKKLILILIIALFSISLVVAFPNKMHVTGVLENSTGGLVNGTNNINFTIYSSSGNPLWSKNVSVVSDTNGIYSVELIDVNLAFDDDYTLGIKIGTDAEMTPRINLTATPYAFRANYSDNLNPNSNLTLADKITFRLGEIIDNIVNGFISITGKLKVSDDLIVNNGVFFVNATSGNIGIGTTSPEANLHVVGNTLSAGHIIPAADNTYDLGNSTNQWRDLYISGSSIRVGNLTISETGLSRTDAQPIVINMTLNLSGQNLSVQNLDVTGNVGIGTTTPSHKLNVVGDINATGNVIGSYLCIDGDCRDAWPLPGTTQTLQQVTEAGSTTSDAITVGGLNSTGDMYVGSGKLFVNATSGYVGIGTTAPATDLQVGTTLYVNNIGNKVAIGRLPDASNALYVNGSFRVDGNSAKTWLYPTMGEDNILYIRNANTSDTSTSLVSINGAGKFQGTGGLLYVSNSQGYNTGTTAKFETVVGYGKTVHIVSTDAGTGSTIGLYIDSQATGFNSQAPRNIISGNLTINGTTLHVNANSGKVGIGTTTPTHTLNVVGDANITGTVIGNLNATKICIGTDCKAAWPVAGDNSHLHDVANLTNVQNLLNTHTHDTNNLTNIAGLNNRITIQGENITGGTINFARLPALIDTHLHNALNITSPLWINKTGDTMTGNLILNNANFSSIKSYLDNTNLAYYWKLDESSGTNVLESMYGVNNGTATGVIWTTGKLNNAANLTHGTDDRIDIASAVREVAPNRNFTLATWFRTLESGGSVTYNIHQVLFEINDGAKDTGIGEINGHLTVSWYDGSFSKLESTAAISDGNWHHGVFVGRSDGTIDIYVDGALNKTGSWNGATGAGTTRIGHGHEVGSFIRTWGGDIDEVAIWNRTLTAAEIKDIYNSGLGIYSNQVYANFTINVDTNGINYDSYNSSKPHIFRINGVEKMRIANDGNVGIGTTAPTHTLNVVGDANITSNLIVNGNTLYVDSSGNKIGIGTSAPTHTLNVIGSANITDDTYIAGNVFINETNVGIGTTTPTQKLNVVGDANITGKIYGSSLQLQSDICGQGDTSGIVSYWQAEGNADDALGRYNGALQGGTQIVKGFIGNTFDFASTGSYVSIPAGTSEIGINSNATLECLFKILMNDSDTNYKHIVFIGDISDPVFGLRIPDTNPYISGFVKVGSTTYEAISNQPFVTNQWYHLIVTYDGETLRLYVNGTKVAENTNPSGSIQTSSKNLSINNYRQNWYSEHFQWHTNGSIDEIAVYNKSLSDADVAAHYSRSSLGEHYCVLEKSPTVIDSRGYMGIGTTTPTHTLNVVGNTNITGNAIIGTANPANQTCGQGDTLGMTAYWKGDGNANDVLGKNNGTLTNGATATGTGKVGNAFGLDGVNDYVNFTSSTSWAFGTGNFTVEQWVKWNSLDTWGDRIFFIAQTLPTYGANYWLGLGVQPASGGIMEVWVNTGPTRLTVPFTPNFGSWYHVVVTRGGTDLRIYINGVSVGNVTDANSITQGPFSIGGAEYDGSSPYYLNGTIDEVAVYNRSLSAADVAAHYSRSNLGSPYCGTATLLQVNGNTNITRNLYVQGNIGIGTTTPTQALNVVGNTNITVNAIIGTANQTCGQGDTLGIISYWQGEGDANDSYGGNNGALVNGATTTATGKIGQAFLLDGTNDYIRIPYSSVWSPGANNFTVEFWVNKTINGSIVGWHTADPNGGWAYGVGPSISWVYVNGGWVQITDTTISSSVWHHIAYTRASTNFTVYVDGSVVSSQIIAGSITNSLNSDLILGARYSGGGSWYGGKLDEVAFYNKALNSSDISAHYTRSNAGSAYCNIVTVLQVNGNTAIGGLSGIGNAYACIDSNGRLYRSAAVCI